MRKLSLFSLLLALGLLLGACGGGNTENNATPAGGEATEGTESAEKVLVGIDVTFPPFEYEENGQYKGIDVDLINAIAADQGFEVELKPMDFKGIIPALLADQIDVAIAGMSITDERKEKVDFADPYFDAGVTLVTKKGNSEITKPEDVAGKIIAAKKGTIGADKAAEINEQYGAKEVRLFDDSPSMFQEVANGNAEVLLEDFPVVAYAIATNEKLDLQIVGDRLNGDQYGIAVKKGENQELLQKINTGLKNLKDSGKYDEILNTYLATE